MQQVKLRTLGAGDVFRVFVETNGTHIVRRFFVDHCGVRVRPPESGTILRLEASLARLHEIPDDSLYWKFRLADWKIYPLKGDISRARDIANTGELFRIHELPQFP